MSGDRRYEVFGFDYDLFNPPDPKAISWYRHFAGEAPGPVLELACGGGTLLVPLARDGCDVTGLDRSEAMLERARERLAKEPAELRERVALVRGEMTGFDVGQTFSLVILADNSIREIETREGILACFSRVRRHLDRGGRFLLAESRFAPERYAAGPREGPFSAEIQDPRTGARVARRVRIEWDREGRRRKGVMTYRVREKDGTERVEELPWVSPVVSPNEVREMLAEAGFASRLFTGYEQKPDDGTDPVLCYVATAE